MSEQQTARILIAAPKSGSGKTTVTCGIIAALKKRGLCVTSFKCGPDYIDPMFHRQVLGVRTGNLDTFFTEDAVTRELLRQERILRSAGKGTARKKEIRLMVTETAMLSPYSAFRCRVKKSQIKIMKTESVQL